MEEIKSSDFITKLLDSCLLELQLRIYKVITHEAEDCFSFIHRKNEMVFSFSRFRRVFFAWKTNFSDNTKSKDVMKYVTTIYRYYSVLFISLYHSSPYERIKFSHIAQEEREKMEKAREKLYPNEYNCRPDEAFLSWSQN